MALKIKAFFLTIETLLLTTGLLTFAQVPTITKFDPTTICQGEKVTITGTNFTDVKSIQLGNIAAKSYTVTGSTIITAIVADNAASGVVKVSTEKGDATKPGLTINPAPIPALQDKSTTGDPFTNCNDNSNYTLIVQNNSSQVAANSKYDIDWGDGSGHFTQTDWPIGAQTSHQYTSQGYFSLKFTITPANNCIKQQKIDFYNGGNPLAPFSTLYPTTSMCADTTVTFTIGKDWANNSPGTYYKVIFGDGSDTTLQQPLNSADTVHWVKHTYKRSSCPNPDFTAELDAVNGCATKVYTQNQIVVRIKPAADFDFQSPLACVNEKICFDNKTTNGYSGTSCTTNTNYAWDFGDGTPIDPNEYPGCHQYAKAGTYTVKLSASNASCGSDAISKTITIKPNSPPPTVSPLTIIYCQNDPATPLSAGGVNLKWYITASGGTGSSTAPTPNTSVPNTTIYYVSQTIVGQCESPRTPITVIVKAKPNPPGVKTPVMLCKGVPATPLTATGSNLLWYTAATGGTGSSTAPTPSTTNVGSTFYYVSQTANNCEGARAAIQVDVIAKPDAPVVISPVTYCQNQASTPLTATGSNLLWYATVSGGIGTPTAPTPSTIVPGTTIYYVSQSNYCGESPRAAITVNVFPGPSATIAYSPASLCNSSTAAAVPVTITGDKSGIFTISPSGLSIDPVTGTLTPANAIPNTYTINYTINASGGCSQFKTTTTVTVSSTPNAAIAYPEICSSMPSVPPSITGTTGGAFSSDAGLVIDKATGNISPATSTVGKHTVTYTIAPSPPCPGFITTADVTIKKAPSASIQYNPSSLCNSATAAALPVTMAGDKGGIFTISPSGLPIDPVTGTLTPANAIPNTYTINYTINVSGGCPQFKTTTTVTVSSTPNAAIAYPEICSSMASVPPAVTGSAGGIFSGDAGLVIDKATGNISPATSTIGKHMVTYTIAPSPPCPGFTTTANVVITKAPSASIQYNPSNLCNTGNAAEVDVTFTGDKGGTFSIQPASGLLLNTSSGTITPAGATANTYTIIYTLKGTGGCKNFADSTTVTVHSTPLATIQYAGSPFCGANSSLVPVILTGNAGGIFTSTTGLSIDANTGAINPSLSKPGTYTVIYTIAPSPPCPGFDTSTKVEIAESPVVSFPVSSQAVCSGETAVFKPISTVPNTVYAWSVEGVLPPGVTGVTSGNVSDPDATISLLFTNTGITSATISIKVTPINPALSPCGGNPATLTLTINPIPAALKADTTTFCMHAPPMALTATPDAGNAIQWYDENNQALSQPPIINTTNPGQFIFYATQVSPSGCESPKAKFITIVHPVAKIISSSYTNPTSCGIPSGSIILNVVDLDGNAMPNLPVEVHYVKFQTAYNVADSTDGSGKIIIPLTAGTYSDIYVATYGCLSQKIPNVFVLKDPDPPAQPVAGYNAPVCSETILNLSASSPTSSQPGAISYVWVGPAFGSLPDTTQNTVVSFPSAKTSYNGTYIVYAMQNNCISGVTSFPVAIKQSPVKPVISTKAPLCVGDNLSLQAYSSISGNGPLSYVWNGPGSGFPVNSANAGINAVKVEDGGVYSITVTSAETGCSVTSDTLIQVGDYPIVKFAQDSFNLPTGHILQLSPSIVNASDPHVLPIQQFAWTPSANIQCNDAACSAPAVTVKNNICYTVKATNIYGCSGSDTVCITTFCKSAQVFIPNAFTPRGLAVNSKFMVRASGIASIKSFRVFNRWGKIVFEKNNFPANDPAFGWDGLVNGKMADMGVYVYTVEVTCENGTPFFYKGNVTLLQ